MKFLFLFLLTTLPVIAQSKFDFKSPANIKQFADYLYCERDFLRAAEEYNRLTGSLRTDTLIFKTGLGTGIEPMDAAEPKHDHGRNRRDDHAAYRAFFSAAAEHRRPPLAHV